MSSKKDNKRMTRRATPEEQARMNATAQWAYTHGLPVVLFTLDGVILAVAPGRKTDHLPVVYLQKDGL
jgi:hypothetical protein